jgi:hypothetical protein
MAKGRLMDYVSRGGTCVVQYSTGGRMDGGDPGPYPFRISRERVSDETAPMTILAPDHPAVTYPNAIGPDDFSGWVQERGLYFADTLDTSYVAVLSANDPGERPGTAAPSSPGTARDISAAPACRSSASPAGVSGVPVVRQPDRAREPREGGGEGRVAPVFPPVTRPRIVCP